MQIFDWLQERRTSLVAGLIAVAVATLAFYLIPTHPAAGAAVLGLLVGVVVAAVGSAGEFARECAALRIMLDDAESYAKALEDALLDGAPAEKPEETPAENAGLND